MSLVVCDPMIFMLVGIPIPTLCIAGPTVLTFGTPYNQLPIYVRIIIDVDVTVN